MHKFQKLLTIIILLSVLITYTSVSAAATVDTTESTSKITDTPTTVYRYKKYSAEDKNKKCDFEKEVTENGQKYVLNDTSFEVTNTTPITKTEHIKRKKTVSDVINIDEYVVGGDKHQTLEVEFEGEKVLCNLTKVEYQFTGTTDRSQDVYEKRMFTQMESEPSPEQSVTTTIYDAGCNQNITVSVPLTNFSATNEYWTTATEPFTMNFSGYDNDYFTINSVKMKKDENTVVSSEHYPALLTLAGLDTNRYRLASLNWNGSTYNSGNSICRNAIGSLQVKCKDYTAEYSCSAKLPDIEKYSVILTYEKRNAELKTGKNIYEIQATATYKLVEAPTTIAIEEVTQEVQPILYVSVGFLFLIILVVVILFVISKNSKKK